MMQILIAVGIALTVSILLTPVLIKLFTRQGFGQEIREDGPPSHHKKRGTPSMGGVAIVAGIWASYLGTHMVGLLIGGRGPTASGLLLLGLATALGGVGFLDDLIKIRRSRNLGLNKTAKTVGQVLLTEAQQATFLAQGAETPVAELTPPEADTEGAVALPSPGETDTTTTTAAN